MSVSEMRAELKALRKSHPDHAPVSKMKKGDLSEMIQRLKAGREETPNVASVPSQPDRVYKSAVESIKQAKASEFPMEHAKADKPDAKKKHAGASAKAMPKPPKSLKEEKMEKKSRPAKGSEEAKAHMAKVRALRQKKEKE
jgi:hypothetical protein